jgi:hypothetical protein
MARRRMAQLGVAILAAGVTVAGAGAASAHPDDDGAIVVDDAGSTHGTDQHHQHGGTDGHLDPVAENVELVSKLKLSGAGPEKVADVTVLGDYAYLAAWGGAVCKGNGVYVVDISDVENPVQVAFVPSKEGSYPGEGMQALSIDTSAWSGDILVTNNEICRGTAGFGGMNVYDISNPSRPVPLAVGVGDSDVQGNKKKTANQIHSVFAWDAGDRAYAVMVDNEEALDVDIMDITNPKKPVLVAEYDLAASFPQILQATPENLTEVFLHDMVVKEIEGRFYMLLSYWDAGYVVLDVTDPLAATYVADSDYAEVDPELLEQTGLTENPEGNAHQAEWTRDNAFIIGTDEDFSPTGLRSTNVTEGVAFQATQGSDTPQVGAGETLSGTTVYGGRACNGDAAVPAAPADGGPYLAVVTRGFCTFTEKVANVEAAGGYVGVVVVNREGGCGLFGMSVDGNIPALAVDRFTGFSFFGVEDQYDDAACRAGTDTLAGSLIPGVALGATGDELSFEGYFDGWGYVHLFEYGEGKLSEVDTYAIPEAMDPAFSTGYGDLSVHEVASSHQRDDLAYLAYYSGGLRVITVGPEGITEVGAFIDDGGNNFWGVEVFERDGVEYIALSDRDYGLYIFRYTGSD